MGTRWASSADKHGIPHEDALYVMRHPRILIVGFDDSRVPGGRRPDLFIGVDRHGRELEVMALVDREARDALVFHVMEARPKIIERAFEVLRERGRKP